MIVEIADDIQGSPRFIYYQVTDDFGVIHNYGPVITSDPAFDAEAHKTVVLVKVSAALAEAEFNQVIG